jgi:hypothetical protein
MARALTIVCSTAWQQRASSGTASGWAARATVAAASASTYLGSLKQTIPPSSPVFAFDLKPSPSSQQARIRPVDQLFANKNKNKNQQTAA